MTTKIIKSDFDNLYLKGVNSILDTTNKQLKIESFQFTNDPNDAMKFEGEEAEAFMQQTLTNYFQWEGGNETAKDYFSILIIETKLTFVNKETY